MVRIELLNETHGTAVLALANDAALSKTSSVPFPCTKSHVDQWVADNQAAARSALTFAIFDDALIVGTVTLKRLEAADHSAELSYWIGAAHQRKGYAVSGSRIALAYAFDELLLDYVHSHSLKISNPSSIRALHKLGFTPDPNKRDIPTDGRFAKHFAGDHWTFVRLDRPADTNPAKF